MRSVISKAAVAALALAALTGVAAAQDTFKVSYAGLDLGRSDDAAEFARRAHRAARRFCTLELTQYPDPACVDRARQAVTAQLPAHLQARLAAGGTPVPAMVLVERRLAAARAPFTATPLIER